MYEPMYTPSWDYLKAVDHYEGKKYECDYCGVKLEDWESFMKGGKIYCGCCK